MVNDVAPYERMKLRMLNGVHSALAYMGLLAGHETVRNAVEDSHLAGFVQELWREEVMPTLDRSGTDAQAYAVTLTKRFSNPAIHHHTRQIAMDGSQKIPQRILPTVRDRLAQRQPITRLARVVAAWIRYVHEGERHYIIEDPVEPQFAGLRRAAAGNLQLFAQGFLLLKPIFGDLTGNP